MRLIVPGTLTRLMPAIAIAMLVACAGPPVMKPTSTHIRGEVPNVVTENIPEPVRLPTILPRPRATAKPETYSVVVNNVRVQELLFALARDAKLNVDIHPGITGVVTLNAIDQTLPQLLSRIAKQTDMRWEIDGPNLVVMPDSPYLRVYKIDYLNMVRTSTSTVSVSGNISSGGPGGGGGGGGNASSTTLTNRADNDFWRHLVENIKELLQETDKILPGSTASQAPPVPSAAPSAPGQASPAGAAPAPAATPAAAGASFREAASVISNSEAGVLSIRATSRQHEKIQEFLDRVMSSVKRQVFIEATIVEVTLSNQYQQGIDWSLIGRSATSRLSITQGAVGTLSGSPAGNFFTGNLIDQNGRLGDFSATVKLLESFGNVRVLSSPKLSVLNNQTALLRVVDDIVYFKVDSTTTAATATAGPVTTFNTTPNIVAVGFIMSVTPQIGDNETVLLNLRPSLTRVLKFVPDPNPSLIIPNPVPQLQRREMESMIKINSGQIAVMGGLIQDEVKDFDDSIPGLNQTAFGSLFGQKNRINNKTELVVFLRPLVVKDSSLNGDYRAYQTMLPEDDFMSRQNPSKPVVKQ